MDKFHWDLKVSSVARHLSVRCFVNLLILFHQLRNQLRWRRGLRRLWLLCRDRSAGFNRIIYSPYAIWFQPRSRGFPRFAAVSRVRSRRGQTHDDLSKGVLTSFSSASAAKLGKLNAKADEKDVKTPFCFYLHSKPRHKWTRLNTAYGGKPDKSG